MGEHHRDVVLSPLFQVPPVIRGQPTDPHLARCRLAFNRGAEVQSCVFHVVVPQLHLTPEQSDFLGKTFNDWWNFPPFPSHAMNEWQGAGSVLSGAEAEVLSLLAEIGDKASLVLDVLSAFTSRSGPVPSNCSLAIGLRTGFAGARNRGRWYYPFLTTEAVDGNDFVGIFLSTVGDFVDAAVALPQRFQDRVTATGEQWALCVAHNNGVRSTGYGHTTVDIVTQVALSDTTLDSQYRRLHKRHNPKE